MERRQSPNSSGSDSSHIERQSHEPQLKVQTSSTYPNHRTGKSPVHEDERRSPRTSALSSLAPAPVSELSYQHYQHYHRQQQQPPHMRLQPRLLPSVFIPSHHVIQSPVAQGMSTPRLPSISMLTAAAALQPRMQRQTSSSSSSSSGPRPSVATAPRSGPTRASVADLPAPPTIHPDDQNNLCRYRNKRCGYPRAIKRNGDRHNLCEKHRAKANQNQRKLESKRRTQKKSPTSTPRTGPEPYQPQQAQLHQQQAQHPQLNTSSSGASAHESAMQAARRAQMASGGTPTSSAYPLHRGMYEILC